MEFKKLVDEVIKTNQAYYERREELINQYVTPIVAPLKTAKNVAEKELLDALYNIAPKGTVLIVIQELYHEGLSESDWYGWYQVNVYRGEENRRCNDAFTLDNIEHWDDDEIRIKGHFQEGYAPYVEGYICSIATFLEWVEQSKGVEIYHAYERSGKQKC